MAPDSFGCSPVFFHASAIHSSAYATLVLSIYTHPLSCATTVFTISPVLTSFLLCARHMPDIRRRPDATICAIVCAMSWTRICQHNSTQIIVCLHPQGKHAFRHREPVRSIARGAPAPATKGTVCCAGTSDQRLSLTRTDAGEAGSIIWVPDAHI